MTFLKQLSENDIKSLKNEHLFASYLLKDCQSGEIFPAIRNNSIDFYHKGGRLFSWNKANGFSTHQKYASVLWPVNDDYVCQDKLSDGSFRLITDFCEGYERIKENCALYSGDEAKGVSQLYHKFSCAARKVHDVVVLDIEVAFTASDEQEDNKKASRIDIVTLEYSTRKLRFFEAKHYSNRASLRSETEPALFKQLRKYDKQLKNNKQEILKAYSSHVAIINAIFETKIPQPTDIDMATKAIIFGFDNEQKAYLYKNIIPEESDFTNRTYAIGEIKKAELSAMFKGGKQNWE